ncbi:DNA-3-methyladenine glycosylase I, partial [Bacteroides sp.]
RGFKFFGSTICYAHLQASGFINDHLMDCLMKRQLLCIIKYKRKITPNRV